MRSLLVALTLPMCVYAQEFRATLAGRISDTTGAAISGATVEIKNVDTGETWKASSDNDGDYQAAFLMPGNYTTTAEKPGFKKGVRDGIKLLVAGRGVVDIQLALGDVSQSVVVSGGAALLETESADRGLTVESKRVLETPLQGQNPFAQALESPGVVLVNGAQNMRPFDVTNFTNVAINGSRPNYNELLVDGVSALAEASTMAYMPTAEAVSEFKVQATNYDAQYGWNLGSVINVTTRNGTNQFHGSAYEYFQNTHLYANTFNSNRTGVPRQNQHVNVLGGDVNGPVIKNKLFFSFSYFDWRQVTPFPFVTSVPTAAQKAGDFSQTYYAASSGGAPLQQAIFDPFSTTAGSNGALVRTPFPGNAIPGSMLNPVAVKVLSFVPLGNVAGNPITGLNNLTNNANTRHLEVYFPEYVGRGDYQISEKTRLFVRYSRNGEYELKGFQFSTNSSFNPADVTAMNPFTRENHNATVQLTHIVNPTTVLDLRLGFERFLSEGGDAQGAAVGPLDLGFSPTFASQASHYFPAFTWSGYSGAGTQPTTVNPIAQTNLIQGLLSKIRGRHSLKFGGEFRLVRGNAQTPGYTAGNFGFDQTFTGANPLQVQPSSGNSIASFLLGTPQSGLIQVNSQGARQELMSSAFVQDDIRVTEKLKVNAGLRWDYLGPMTDRFNELARGFASNVPNPLQVPGQTVYGGLLFAGVNGQPRGIFDSRYHNFGPRFGAAYQVTRHTVLRGGYALVFGQQWNDPGNAPGFSQTTSMVTSIQTGVPFNTLANPFPAGILHPAGSTLGLATALGQSFSFANTDGGQPPYVHQFSFEVQHELPKDFLITAAFVGSRSRDIPVSRSINEISANSLALGASALTKNVTNPFAGLIPGTSINGATVQQQQLLRPFPEFLGITELFFPIGQSSYNAGQLVVYKRLSFGLNFSVSYSISKQIDRASFANAQDSSMEKVIASWDVPQTLGVNLVYELPFGTGKPIGAGLTKPVRWLIGGWEVSTLTRLQKGMPMNFPTNAAPTGINPAQSDPSLTEWFNTCTLLANGSTRGCIGNQQAAWTIRQPNTLQMWSSRLSGVRLPGIHNVDASLMKNNRITERMNLIFRVDFINATNSPQFYGGPVVDVNSANFGRISGTTDQSNLPRFIQFSMRLKF
jgi:hypothetical protein